MKKIKSSVLALCTLSVLSSACVEFKGNLPLQGKSKKASKVTNESGEVNKLIGDEKTTLQVVSPSLLLTAGMISADQPQAKTLLKSLSKSPLIKTKSLKAKTNEAKESLLLGFPLDLVGEENIFGGVITKVSDKENENLGMLKLTDFTPIHTRSLIAPTPDGGYALVLVGCASNCDEETQLGGLIQIPIVGVNEEKKMIVLDLGPIGQELDLVSMMDPTGGYTKLKAISSEAVSVEYELKTLLFDIKTKMIPVDADAEDPNAKVTEFTVRWYMRLSSAFNPAFTSRTPTPGVGFFETQRGATTKITRFATGLNGKSIHYYIKNVPDEWKETFAGALDNWNVEFKKVLGREVLTYEFLDSSDPRHADIVPGDIRYNVIEWDVDNIAPYGGLGPSIANQFTGETLSAATLIQGPKIIEIYTKWFKLSEQARNLKSQGLHMAANKLMKDFSVSVSKEMKALKQNKFKMKLGDIEMTVQSQRPELEDPMVKNDFEVVPAGWSFEDYMKGYFSEMLAHELGHNLGLRHNFRGNLGAIETGEKGTVSRSIMEYLGRGFRHLNAIGLYDRMAIAYGYKGEAPKHLDWFCTDEDQASSTEEMKHASPECSKSDATSDPYSFWESRLTRAIDMLVDTKSTEAPVWKTKEIEEKINEAVSGLSAYALSAEATADKWTNFFGKSDRPEDKAEVKAYVLTSLKKKICDPRLAKIVEAKESPEAKKLATENLVELKKTIETKSADLGLYSTADLGCE